MSSGRYRGALQTRDRILMALYKRIHDLGTGASLLHERNQAAFEVLHPEEHDAKHDDLQELVRKVLSDKRGRHGTGSAWQRRSAP